MSRLIDLSGLKFERLTALHRAQNTTQGQSQWFCSCSCGKTLTTSGDRLRRKQVSSCGCFQQEMRMKAGDRTRSHGETRANGTSNPSPEYRAWSALKDRCTNTQCPRWIYYGGRGIQVCERWKDSFVNFLSDMGRRPSSSHSLDRYPNNDGNYEPGNCRWATRSEQRRNRRDYRPKIADHDVPKMRSKA